MASYGVYLAACGFEYSGPQQYIGFAPKLTPDNFKCAFIAAEGWGSYSQKIENGKLTATIAMRWGKLPLKTITLENAAANSVQVVLAGKSVTARLTRDGRRVSITLNQPVEIAANATLKIIIS